jgi:hypothetical protein
MLVPDAKKLGLASRQILGGTQIFAKENAVAVACVQSAKDEVDENLPYLK